MIWHGFAMGPISFAPARGGRRCVHLHDHPADQEIFLHNEIWDPVNPANNVARTYSDSHRVRLVKAAATALDDVAWATQAPTKGDANDAWRNIFGPGFEGA
jgi:hypothetical protein